MRINFDTLPDDYEQSLEDEIAVHEAGHAVMAYLLEMPFNYVTLVPNGSALGHVSLEGDPDGEHHLSTFQFDHPRGFAPFGFGNRHDTLIRPEVRVYVESLMLICAAGLVSQVLYIGDDVDAYWFTWGQSTDEKRFAELARSLTGSEDEFDYFCRWMLERAKMIMSVPAHAIVVEELAREMKMHRTLQYDQACAIIKAAFEELRDPVVDDRVRGRNVCGVSR
jgi:hypothetical protein